MPGTSIFPQNWMTMLPGSLSTHMKAKCVTRVANAIYSNFLAEKSDEVFFIKSLDFILIALEAPFGIRATSSDKHHRQFDSCDLANMVASAETVTFPTGIQLRLFCYDLDQDNSRTLLDEASNLLSLISNALEWYAAGRIAHLGNRINSAIYTLSAVAGSNVTSDPTFNDPPGNENLLDQFFQRLDHVALSTAGELYFFPTSIVGPQPPPRFFFFHRNILNSKYGMQLYPLASQEGSGGAHLRLAEEGIWTFDNVVSKGLVSWIRWPWDTAKSDIPTEILAFRAYLNELTSAHNRPSGRAGRANSAHKGLAVPMHVGGIAWLVVLFVFAADEDNYGELAYYICRHVVPTLFEKVASLARDEYLRLVHDRTRTSLGSGKFDIATLNECFKNIAPIFPYKEWYLSSDVNKYAITAFKTTYYLHEKPTSSSADLLVVDFRTIQSEAVRDRIQSTALELEREIHEQQEKTQQADEGIGHALKNIVDLTNWTEALPELLNLNKNFNKLLKSNRHDEILRRVQLATQSLSMFSPVAGLGHFARLAGAVGRGDFKKFTDWHDAEELKRWTSTDCDEKNAIYRDYVNTVYQIVYSLRTAFQLNDDPVLFEVTCNTERLAITRSSRDQDADHNGLRYFNPKTLHIPPFKTGSDAGYSFIFALTEPLVNALRALRELRRKPNSGLASSELILRIQVVPRLPTEVLFLIKNPSVYTVQGTLSGFAITRRMLRRIGIAEIDDLYFQEMRPSLYEVVAGVHFRPYDFAIKIAGQWREDNATKPEATADRR